MVGPSISDDDRKQFLFRIRVAFALFVGISMALVVVRGNGDLILVGGGMLAGTAVGGVLAWWIFPDSLGTGPRNR